MAATKAAEYQLEFLNCGAQDNSLPAARSTLTTRNNLFKNVGPVYLLTSAGDCSQWIQ